VSRTLLQRLIYTTSRLPGLGPRSGRRLALFLLKNRQRLMAPLVVVLKEAMEKLTPCTLCGYWIEGERCPFCHDPKRDASLLCVVSEVADVWALEKLGTLKGHYHILGGSLSILEGIGPQHLRIDGLLARLQKTPPKELILALAPTVEGSTTSHYLIQEIKKIEHTFKITSLARGVPLGGELDFLDEGTLEAALSGRHTALL